MTAYAEPENQLGPEIWERYPGEPVKAYSYFLTFCSLGPGRKISDLAEKVKKSVQYLYRLSSEWNWAVRSNAKDLDEERRRSIEVRQQAVAVYMAQLLVSRGMLHWATRYLSQMNDDKLKEMTPTEVARWAATAASLGRSTLGEPDQRIHHTIESHTTPAGFRPISTMTDAERRAELGELLKDIGDRVRSGEILPDEEALYGLLAIPEQRAIEQ